MAMFIASRSALLRALLLSATTLGLLAANADARVGVTSATDGDPTGKPPNETERVLRIGIDVQANEVVTTHANDRAHLVFLDGTSLTVGPNAQVTIDKFVYDPATKVGDLAISTTQGVFRLVGGKISKTNAIVINTPSSTIGIRGGITIFSVTRLRTIANFIFGNSMTVNGTGKTETVTRPGSQVSINLGSPPSPPSLLPPGGLSAEIAQLETGKSSSPGGTGSPGSNPDQAAQNSGLSSGPPANNPPNSGNNTPNTNTNNITQATNNTNTPNTPNNAKTPTTPAPTPPVPRTTQTLKAYTNGVIVGVNGSHVTARVPEVLLSRPTDVSVTTNATTNQSQATVIIRGLDGTLLSPTATLQFGGTSTSSFFIDDKTYGMTQTDDPSRPSKVKPLIGQEKTITLTDGALVSAAANSGSSVPIVVRGTPGACTCDFLSWGWWQADIHYTNGYRAGQTDIIAAAPYVVGMLTTAVQMPQTGSATFNGFMAGSVQNGANAYNAYGSYSSSWNFASRIGNFNASFDGKTYAGGAAAVPGSGGTNFVGAFAGGGNVGTLAGSFFGTAAQSQAGSFAISGSQYKAGGIFAGSR
jgi:hypothetical protein